MKTRKSHFILPLILIFFMNCSTTTKLGKSGKIREKNIYSKKIDKDHIGVSIRLYNLKDNKELNISELKELPGLVIDSAFNYKLLIFHKDSIPSYIMVDRKDKMPLAVHLKKAKKNLIMYEIYLGDDIRGVM
ncbi:hypothetical protein ACR79M_15490 [Sphingobacterium spiritivorum]|uniref:hypothetical protein n=1 Tax=Sphingobacterium spiritivorum TaxID=258 RepID=UPI003DA6A4C5